VANGSGHTAEITNVSVLGNVSFSSNSQFMTLSPSKLSLPVSLFTENIPETKEELPDRLQNVESSRVSSTAMTSRGYWSATPEKFGSNLGTHYAIAHATFLSCSLL
jgi:hypothetical protein